MQFTSLLRPSPFSGKSRSRRHPPHQRSIIILLEVSNLTASIAFYRDFVGLRLKSQSDWFVMLESNNVGVFLRNSRWDWEKPRSKGEQLGLGMHPHFEVSDAAAMVEKLAKLVIGLSRSQGNMILEPKLSLLTLMVTLGPLYLRQSLPVAKRGRCVNYARLDFNKASPLPEDH